MTPEASIRRRLFLGLALPPHVATELAEEAERRFAGADVRLILADDLHATLLFFGEVGPEVAAELVAETRALEWSPLRVRTGELARMGRTAIAVRLIADGVEPLRRRLRDPEDALGRMARHVPAAERGRGLELHATVARTKAKGRGEAIELPCRFEEREFALDRIVLYESLPTPSGARYRPLAEARGAPSTIREQEREATGNGDPTDCVKAPRSAAASLERA